MPLDPPILSMRLPCMAPGVEEDIQRITAIWQNCRQEFGDKGNFLFGQFTIADAMFAPVVSRFTTYSVELDPVAQAYAETINSLPAMTEWAAAGKAEPERIERSELYTKG